jgi:transcriptional regulator with XRE-family HTH domain
MNSICSFYFSSFSDIKKRRMDIIDKLGKKIREVRKQRGLTQAELAEKAGISVNFIGKVERGIHSPSVTTIERIAEALNVKVSALFDFPEEIPKKEYEIKELIRVLRDGNSSKIKIVTDIAKKIIEELPEE